MTRRLTNTEAVEFVETILECGLDTIGGGVVEAFAFDMGVDQVRADLDSYLAGIADEIDPDSITITSDKAEGTLLPCAHVFIRTSIEGQA